MSVALGGAAEERVAGWRVFVRVLGASWISIFSIVAGYLTFVSIPESQDLLLDVRQTPSKGIVYWTWFFLVTYFCWVNMATSGARLLILQRLNEIGRHIRAAIRGYFRCRWTSNGPDSQHMQRAF